MIGKIFSVSIFKLPCFIILPPLNRIIWMEYDNSLRTN
jgi:hypothetical protein